VGRGEAENVRAENAAVENVAPDSRGENVAPEYNLQCNINYIVLVYQRNAC